MSKNYLAGVIFASPRSAGLGGAKRNLTLEALFVRNLYFCYKDPSAYGLRIRKNLPDKVSLPEGQILLEPLAH